MTILSARLCNLPAFRRSEPSDLSGRCRPTLYLLVSFVSTIKSNLSQSIELDTTWTLNGTFYKIKFFLVTNEIFFKNYSLRISEFLLILNPSSYILRKIHRIETILFAKNIVYFGFRFNCTSLYIF